MKRTNATPAPNALASGKRTKSGQACTSCRKHKTRCEILDDGVTTALGVVKCHRCKVLGVECSFESSDIIRVLPQQPQQATPFDLWHGTPGRLAAPHTCSLEKGDEKPTKRDAFMDWTATPMTSIFDLTLKLPQFMETPNQPPILAAEKLEDILTADQISALLKVFEEHYVPWLCFELVLEGKPTPFLDLVRCTIASRHLDVVTRSHIAPRLQNLTETVAMQQIFAPTSILEYLQATLIGALWAPISGVAHDRKDARLLIAAAISMAMNINLAQSSAKALALRKDKETNSDSWSATKEAELAEFSAKARLWAGLAAAESMLCIGTGRTPLSMCSEADQEFLKGTSYATLAESRQSRLGFTARLYTLAESASRIRLVGEESLRPFYMDAIELLMKLDYMERLISPIPVVSTFDPTYYRVLQLQYHTCRLLVLHHLLQELRTAFAGNDDSPWFKIECQGTFVITAWGRDALSSAEAALSIFLSLQNTVYPSTSPAINSHPTSFVSMFPDHFFLLVSFAAAWLVVPNFSIHQMQASQIGSLSGDLVRITKQRMASVALISDHAPASCAKFISALLGAWEGDRGRKASLSPSVSSSSATSANTPPTGAATNPPVQERTPPTQEPNVRPWKDSSLNHQNGYAQVPAYSSTTSTSTSSTTTTTMIATTTMSGAPSVHPGQVPVQQLPIQQQTYAHVPTAHPSNGNVYAQQQQQRPLQNMAPMQPPPQVPNAYSAMKNGTHPSLVSYMPTFPSYPMNGHGMGNGAGMPVYPSYTDLFEPSTNTNQWDAPPLIVPSNEGEFWNSFMELMASQEGILPAMG
ncbi:hypothetical protein BDN72DRAFT_855813 [Pluteus cervinus]|uniref:Uncharacterized protein n=1 Tax=Pluteus cervinus TaxID=181527 RepID=A0ACD3B364_9AGAR|nr:hypothetical protein BDN72DRAFT_855813 [Pluteus cervinus]